MGRRTILLKPEIKKRILDAIRQGNYVYVACRAAGIGETTYHTWMAKGREAIETGKRNQYREFTEAVKEAELLAESELILSIRSASLTSWQAAAWLLERKTSERWGRKDSIEYRGEVVETKVVNKAIDELLDDQDTIEKANEILKKLSFEKGE